MAKLAVLFLAALAFQATYAGVRRYQGGYGATKGGYQLNDLVSKIQMATGEVTTTLRDALPSNRQTQKILTWQSKELAQYIDEAINKLESEATAVEGGVFQQLCGELRQVQNELLQISSWSAASNVHQMKVQFYGSIENIAEILEKLVQIVEGGYGSQVGVYATLKGVLYEFLNITKKIQTQFEYIGQDSYNNRASLQIQEVTEGLLNALQEVHTGNEQLQVAFHEYAQNIEQIVNSLEGQMVVGAGEYEIVAQRLAKKLRQVRSCLNQITGTLGSVTPIALKSELKLQLENVASILEHLTQVSQSGAYNAQIGNPIDEIIKEYLSATQQATIQIQGGSIWGYGSQKNSLGFLGGYQDKYLNDFPGEYQSGYQSEHSGLLARSQSKKGLAIHIQAVVSDLSASLQNVVVDNSFVRQVLVNQIQRYAQYLELIVEKLQSAGATNSAWIVNEQQVLENLKQIVESLWQIVHARSTISATELRTQLVLYVQKAANEFEKLTNNVYATSSLQTDAVVKNVIVQFLIATRNLQVQVQNITYLGGQSGHTSSGLGIQIQTYTNGLTNALQWVSMDNKQAREVLAEQCREFARDLHAIVSRLESTVTYNGVSHNIAENLMQIVNSLQQTAASQDYATAHKLRLQLIVDMQNAVNEIQKLLWAGTYSHTQGYENSKYFSILSDFSITLKNQQIQLQNIYQTSQYGQNTQKLAYQIQAITNNLAVFLQNINYNGEQGRQNIVHQAKKIVQTIENIIERLDVEMGYSTEVGYGGYKQIAHELKQIVASLEWTTAPSSNYELSSQLYIVLQNVASEFKKLAWLGAQQHGAGNYVTRSVLIQYLVAVQNMQIQVQGISQTYQIGQTPRELSLQIQVVAGRLSRMLYVALPDNGQTATALVWQARKFAQIIENIAYRLQGQSSTSSVYQQVAVNLQQIQQALEHVIIQTGAISTHQLKAQLAVYVHAAATEVQKLMWVAQTDLQVPETQGHSLVRNILTDFLYGLQNLQIQVQSNLQIVWGGQHPKSLAIQIQSTAQRISSLLQYSKQSNSQYLRQTIVIQLGELAQTIENVVNVLQTEVTNKGDRTDTLQEIAAQLTKISQQLQQISAHQAAESVEQLSYQLDVQIQNVAAELERLAYVTVYQYQQQHAGRVGTVLNGAFNNLLATLRNMFIQLQNTYQMGQYGQSVKELSNQIQTVTTTLTTSLQNVFANTKQIRQALAIQTLKYARRIRHIVERLQTESTYYKGATLQEVVQHLKQVVVALQQIGQSEISVTANELRTYLNTQVQNADAQIQKLLAVQSTVQVTQGVAIDAITRSALLEYLAAVQNLEIQVQNIAQRGQKGQSLRQLATQIEITVYDLCRYLEQIVPTNSLAIKAFAIEARQLGKVIANIAYKLQTGKILGTATGGRAQILYQQVARQLYQIQLVLQQQVAAIQTGNVEEIRIQLAVQVQNAAVVIEQLIWAVQPQLQLIQGNTGDIALVRSCLNEFWSAVQNVQIQIQTVIENGQSGRYSWGLVAEGAWNLNGQQIGQYGSNGLGFLGEYIGSVYGVHSAQMYQYPRQLVIDIQNVVSRLCSSLQGPIGYSQQSLQILKQQVWEFEQILANIVDQLQGLSGYGYGNAEVVLQQVTRRLRQVQLTLQKIVDQYSTPNGVNQLRTEFDMEIQYSAAEIENLVWIVQQTEGKLDVIVKQILQEYLSGIQKIDSQVQGISQVGGYENLYGQYGSGYGSYAGAYGTGYGYGSSYGSYPSGDIYNNKYEQGYGYGSPYTGYGSSHGYGSYFNKYGRGYGYQNQDLVGDYEYLGGLGQALYEDSYQGQQYAYQQGPYAYEGPYGSLGQYGSYRAIQSLQGESVTELANQVQMLASQVAREIETAPIGGKRIKQALMVQGRQLDLIIDNIIDRLQSEVTMRGGSAYGTVQQVVENLRQIRMELQQVYRSGYFYGSSQIKGQISNQIENIAQELLQLVYVATQGDYQGTVVYSNIRGAIKNVLGQYLVFLDAIQYELQESSMYWQYPTNQWASQYEFEGPQSSWNLLNSVGLSNYQGGAQDLRYRALGFNRLY